MKPHPALLRAQASPPPPPLATLDPAWIDRIAREAGADDVAFVPLDHPDLAEEVPFVGEALPGTRSLVAFVVRTARTPIRSPLRSVANGEFHRATDKTEAVGAAIVAALEAVGVPALVPSVGFPMEMDRFPARGWVVAHKRVAEAAGLGRMGIHRNVIHPKFGSYVLLGTVLVGADIPTPVRALDFNPCFECRLCVAACPVGAIRPDGGFDAGACLTHNYREFMGGFNEWVGTIAEASNRWDYRAKVGQAETASWWQSLTKGPFYKAAYCVAACPAGDDVIGPYLADKKGFVAEVVEPLRAKVEPIYVMPGTDAEAHAAARYPHKALRRVEGGLYAESIPGFVRGAPLLFQAKKAKDERVVVAFRFGGAHPMETTFRVAEGRLAVTPGLAEDADVTVTIDGADWLDVLNRRRNPVWLVFTGRMRIAGDRAALDRFQRCFPSPKPAKERAA